MVVESDLQSQRRLISPEKMILQETQSAMLARGSHCSEKKTEKEGEDGRWEK